MISSPSLQRAPETPRRKIDPAGARLGLGCASLGSRIDAKAGLRALAIARDAGVTWFDVAPAYGAGDAEALLGQFLRDRREGVSITTKVGIAPPARLGAIKLAYAVGRPVIGAASRLRGVFRRLSATRNRHVPITAELVESSILRSLDRMRIDHVDVYALHDPSAEDLTRDDVLRALERVLSRGQARRVAVAGDAEACRAAVAIGGPFEVLQTSVADFGANRDEFARSGHAWILHSVFGVEGARDRLSAALRRCPERARRLIELGYDRNPKRAAAQLLLDNAFALNPGGTVLASMFAPDHLATNITRARRRAPPNVPELLGDMLA
jgi:aryl-alcohol dehydrogenase-like predicted oxidoreductase